MTALLSALLPLRERVRPRSAAVPSLAPQSERSRTALAVAIGVVMIIGLVYAGPMPGPSGLLLTVAGCALSAVVLGSPLVTTVLLLLASFVRMAIQVGGLPAEPMTLLFVALVASAAIAGLRGRTRFHFGPLEAAMAAYVLWNIVSMVWPHLYPAVVPKTGEEIVLYRFLLMGTVFPFVGYVVGRAYFRSASRIRVLLFSLLAFAAYSAVVSVLQFTGPKALVWPRYIVDSPSWPERAVGVFNQPVCNGLVMSAGFVAAVLLARERSLPTWQRVLSALVAPMCVVGVYLTHTRAVLIVFGLALVLCAFIARGARTVFVAMLIAACVFLAAEWATITSADRTKGGLGSASEIHDRLNMITTSFWAIGEQPVMGWGFARFQQVNTHHHKQWSSDVKWESGYGYSSHENELGIAVELGLVGLGLWLTVLALLARQVVGAFRRLPTGGMNGRVIGVIAIVALLVWFGSGATVDLRFFDFANLMVFLIAGAAVGASIESSTEDPRNPTASSIERRDGVAV
ncbi:O-antigen ligase [Pseudonocardia hierapolitana]|uniref:O-antigen ligase n=1 Tax=Pseudonocardia hierapolitana TaxID=1128676 RepID=A0A561SVS7_9PSEU|nr:O-antigen ligase family protein [Pseudonocardia hierapolitana]TWF78968.1 O-antigen ligase [Pseudonocardia hierapolitana]